MRSQHGCSHTRRCRRRSAWRSTMPWLPGAFVVALLGTVALLGGCSGGILPSTSSTGIVGAAGEQPTSALQDEAPFTVQFTADPVRGHAPLRVTFAPSLSGTFPAVGTVEWWWDFGDGSTSSEMRPVHQYTEPGTYTVAVTVTWVIGQGPGERRLTATCRKPDYIHVKEALTVYWTNQDDSTIRSSLIWEGPGPSTIIADEAVSGVSSPVGLDVVGNTLYWANAGDSTIRSCPIGVGPTFSTIISDHAACGVEDPVGLEVVGRMLYWANAGDSTIRELVIGAPPTKRTIVADRLTSGVLAPCGLQAVGSALYWANAGDNTIRKCALVGNRILLTEGSDAPRDPSTLLVAHRSTVVANRARSGVNRPSGLQVVDGVLYWANAGDNTIRRCPLGAFPSPSTVIANRATSKVDGPCGLQVDDGIVYWVNTGDSTIRSCPIGTSPAPSTVIADLATSGVAGPVFLHIPH